MLRLSSSECVLKREVEEGRDALDKMAALSSALALDKRELNKQLLQVVLLARRDAGWLRGHLSRTPEAHQSVCVCFQLESELSDSQTQLQALRSEVNSLQRDVKTLNLDCSQLR